MTTGNSWRTRAKHELMWAFAGQEVGVASRPAGPIRRLLWLDLTAGDAAARDADEWHRGCSPGILAWHATRSAKPVEVRLYEIDKTTYGALLDNLAAELPGLGYARIDLATWELGEKNVTLTVINRSGRTAEVTDVRRTDAVLVLNDPNAMAGWAMRQSFASEIAARTVWFRSLSTMGCNAHGHKRLPLDGPPALPLDGVTDSTERRAWFDLIGDQERSLSPSRDLLLAAIEHDDAQWAYLLSTAEKWRPQTEAKVRAAFAEVGRAVALAWYRQDPEAFEKTKRTLFLTQRELRDQANTPLPFDDDQEDQG